jgi:DME family drug/metabolite transporter
VSRTRLVGIAAIAVTSVLWGTTGTAATFAPAAGPLAIGAAALGAGGLLQAAAAAPALRAAWPSLRAQGRVVAWGAVSVGVYPLAFYSSMRAAGVAVGTVVSLASAPLVSGLLERFAERRPLSRSWMLAAALGVAGSVLLCASRMSGPESSAIGILAGISLGLVAGATYAAYSWAASRLMRSGIDRAAAMGAVFGGGGALLVPVLLLTGAPLVESPRAFLVAGYMALIPMFCGYLLFGIGLARVPASTATTVTLLEPAIAAILAVAVVGERLTSLAGIGLAVIAGALLVLTVLPAGTSHPADRAAETPPSRGLPPPDVA